MHRSTKMMMFAGAGFVLAALLAIVVISLGSGSGTDKVHAVSTPLTPTKFPTKPPCTPGPTATPGGDSSMPCTTATPLKTPKGAGNLKGVYDIYLHAGNVNQAFYFCIARQDHYVTGGISDNLKSALTCYSDLVTQYDPSNPLPNSQVCPRGLSFPGTPTPTPSGPCTSNANPDLDILGPPPPPPYSGINPQKATGLFFPGADTSTQNVCFQGVGGNIGPNIIAQTAVSGVKAGGDHTTGTTSIYVNQSAANCAALTPVGPVYGVPLTTEFYRVADLQGNATGTLGPALTGRDAAHALDYDGDGCLDKDELDKNRAVKNCGDDPTNPLDSDHNYQGVYDITVQSTEATLCEGGQPRGTIAYPFGCMGEANGTYLPGGYFNCIGTIQHTKVTPQPKYEPISAKAFCYVDNPLSAVNSQAAGSGVCPVLLYSRCGNGSSGIAPPSFPPKATGPAETNLQCINTSDDDGDTIPNDGCTNNWADNNARNDVGLATDMHTNLGLLKGWLDNNNNVLVLEGCFIVDAPSTFAPATYARLVVDQHTGLGSVDIWRGEPNCAKPGGAPDNDNFPVIITQQETTEDTDRDGCTDGRELGGITTNNWGAAANGGLRDPFWTFDFFDADGNGANGLADINFIANPSHIFKTDGQFGYTWRADRTAVQTGSANPAPPASVVALGPPDRAIGLTDVNLSARQFANACPIP